MLLAKPSARVYQAASLRGDGTGWPSGQISARSLATVETG
ncbi:hypothetical protein ACVWZA_002999 [Sphingomonas sp. UYAg733]